MVLTSDDYAAYIRREAITCAPVCLQVSIQHVSMERRGRAMRTTWV
jgi:hypothetical protein